VTTYTPKAQRSPFGFIPVVIVETPEKTSTKRLRIRSSKEEALRDAHEWIFSQNTE
jgi:hypothetical protein